MGNGKNLPDNQSQSPLGCNLEGLQDYKRITRKNMGSIIPVIPVRFQVKLWIMAEPYQMIKSRSSLGWNLEGSQGSRQVPGKNIDTFPKPSNLHNPSIFILQPSEPSDFSLNLPFYKDPPLL